MLDAAGKDSEQAPSEKGWKSLLMIQKMKSGLIPEAQVEKELINLINSISSAVLPGNEVASTNKLSPVFQERLAEAGRVALQFNLVNIADSITKKAGPLIDNKTGTILHSV